MNYLAHAYLSFDDPEITVGNMISDYVKGRKKYDYPARILQGIDLHRFIDNFTDDHFSTRAAKDIFRPHYRLYSAAFVDIVYDHFLALDETRFSPGSLLSFSQAVYEILEKYYSFLPFSFQQILPYMKAHNWLYNYRLLEGIEKSFGGLVRRSAYLTESGTAFFLLKEKYTTFRDCYRSFIGDVVDAARKELNNPGSSNTT